jgi:predicted nucleotidyltransferase
MRTVESAVIASSLPIERIQHTLQKYPVELAILFGSHATDTSTPQSDIDIAVAFEDVRSSEPSYNMVFFGLSADLSDTLGSDDVDLADLYSMPSSLLRSVFEDGVLLAGDEETAARIRHELTEATDTRHSPRDRLDTALARIDGHLDTDPGTPTTPAPEELDDG